MSGKVVLGAGDAPGTYYSPGDGAPRFVQEAHVGWKAPLGRGLLVEAGIFPSPIGPEVFAIQDDWNWSRSNLFFALPFYQAGAQATYDFGRGLSATVGGYNGWNHVLDDNGDKSIGARVDFARGASPIFWSGADWVASGTVTLDARPTRDHLSIRLEYRHDCAGGPLYFAGAVPAGGGPDARGQDTFTLGAAVWL